MHWNQTYFNGQLSPEVCEVLSSIEFQDEEERNFLERMFRFMQMSRFDARDFSTMLAWVLKVLPSRLLPFAWGGLIPPVTVPGRHKRINDFIQCNPWHPLSDQPRLLDLGCGFPPITTTELADAFPAAHVTGADPAFAAEIVYDPDGNYACFYGNDDLPRYFQMVTGDAKRWQEFFANTYATKKGFAELRNRLQSLMTSGPDTYAVATTPEGKLVRNPLREYESDRLSFRQSGFFELEMSHLEVIRCFNVLLYYNAAFRQSVLDWVGSLLRPDGLFICGTDWHQTTQARYTVYQNVEGKLKEREFAFSVDNIRPVGIVSWFALHDDDSETNRMCKLVSLLRSNEAFRSSYDRRLDELLLQHELSRRNEEGYAVVIDPNRPALESQRRLNEVLDSLEKEDFASRAVDVLRVANINAVVNCTGHIAVLK